MPTASGSPRADALDELHAIARQLGELRDWLEQFATQSHDRLAGVHPDLAASALNLVHYLAFRTRDLRDLQQALARHGLSSLGRCEAHVLASVDATLRAARACAGASPLALPPGPVGFDEGARLLARHGAALFGSAPAGRGTRIMVTMPSEAADDRSLVDALVVAGMDCARVNCAHGGPADWARIIRNVRRAALDAGRHCPVLMDLAGPKLRTGALEPGPAVVRLKPGRAPTGHVVTPYRAWLSGSAATQRRPSGDVVLPLEAEWLAAVTVGEALEFVDARGARRRWRVVAAERGRLLVEGVETAYLVPGATIRRIGTQPADGREGRIGALPATEGCILLRRGERLRLRRDPAIGRPAVVDEVAGTTLCPAEIGCTLPAALDAARVGDAVWFDDGRIGGRIESISDGVAEVLIVHAKPAGSRLRADKGINLPATLLETPALTAKDQEDLQFVARNADLVGLSFVNRPSDVEALHAALDGVGGGSLGVVLKIETTRAFDDVGALLLAAMRRRPCGVMIARGDLAVECGFGRLAEVQEELLWLCESAHVPVIWATEVLDGLARSGRPSRAEVTDAAASHRAECVMLNKGPYVVEAVSTLADILGRMAGHQAKKAARLRPLGVAGRFRQSAP